MRRSALSAILAATLSLFACSDQPTEAPTTAPLIPRGPASLVVCTAAGIQAQIDVLFPAGGLRTSAQAQFSSIPKAVDKETGTAARDKTIAIVDFLLTTYYAGQLTGGLSTATLDQVLDLIRSFYCFARLASPDLPSTTGGSDVVVVLVSPGDPTTTVVTPSEHAAVTIPEGAVPAPTLIAVSLLPDDPPPLRTSLDQYPLFYHFSGTTATGPVTFNLDVTAGVCLRDNIEVPDDDLRLAHNVGPLFGDVEILPRPASVPGLDCTDLGSGGLSGSMGSWVENRFAWAKKLLLPAELQAASVALVTLGVGGTTKKFSEFGVVDIFSNPGSFSHVGPASATEEGGSTVTRTVLVTSANGTPIPGVPVTFATSNGTLVTPQPVFTDDNGRASASWTLPATPGTYTLTATAPAEDNSPLETTDPPAGNVASIPDVAFDPTSLTFTVTVQQEFGFENGEPEWTTTGFWNRSTLAGITNAAFTSGAVQTFVLNADGAPVPGGALPSPFDGSFAMWYGQPSSGNFLSGTSSNSGNVTSPVFTVPSTTDDVYLELKTWWEIEGVNPRSFDIMQIQLVNAAGSVVQVLRQLNPLSDPTSPAAVDRIPLAYTSGGFNTAPVWQDISININAHRGQLRAIRFVFSTGDGNYNNFRGWIVDDVAIRFGGALPSVSASVLSDTPAGQELVPVDQIVFPERQEP